MFRRMFHASWSGPPRCVGGAREPTIRSREGCESDAGGVVLMIVALLPLLPSTDRFDSRMQRDLSSPSQHVLSTAPFASLSRTDVRHGDVIVYKLYGCVCVGGGGPEGLCYNEANYRCRCFKETGANRGRLTTTRRTKRRFYSVPGRAPGKALNTGRGPPHWERPTTLGAGG